MADLPDYVLSQINLPKDDQPDVLCHYLRVDFVLKRGYAPKPTMKVILLGNYYDIVNRDAFLRAFT